MRNNNIQATLRRTRRRGSAFNCFARDPRVMTIRTGLSVTVDGYVVSLERDEAARVATVTVSPLPPTGSTGVMPPSDAVVSAARLLASRAERMLGSGWRVARWHRSRPVPGPTGG